MYSSRLYKYRDSYVLYTPTVHTFGSVNFTTTLLVQTHAHDVSAPCIIRTLLFIIHGTPCINAVLYSLFIVHPVLYGLHSAVSKTSI